MSNYGSSIDRKLRDMSNIVHYLLMDGYKIKINESVRFKHLVIIATNGIHEIRFRSDVNLVDGEKMFSCDNLGKKDNRYYFDLHLNILVKMNM